MTSDSNSTTLQQRKRRFALSGAAGVTLVAVVVVLLNLLSQAAFLRFDLTANGSYSLSGPSKKLVRDLDDRLLIKVFFTPNLPPPYSAFERYTRDILAEYRAASKGKVKPEFVLTEPAADFEQRAQEAGLFPLQFEEVGSDKLAIRRGFMGLILYYRDKSEVIPVIRDIQQLEFDLTSRIARMAARQKKTLAYTTGHGEANGFAGPRSPLAQDLEPLYELKPVSLSPATTAPIEADGLIVSGPAQRLDDAALRVIDQTIMRGIPVAFFVDAKNVMPQQFMTSPLESGLPPLLAHYGVQVGRQLVYDSQAETISITQNLGGFAIASQVRYAYIPVITGMSGKHPLLRGIEALSLPFVTTVEQLLPADPKAGQAGIQFTPLLQTSTRSWLEPADHRSINPMQIPQPKPDEPHGPFIVGAVLEGSFTSYFAGKPAAPGLAPMVEKSPRTSVLVVGTSHLADPALPPFRGTEPFMTNVLAWLSKDEVLLGIRSKGDLLRPLKPLKDGARISLKVLGVFGPPMLVTLIGLWRWRSRRAWRRTVHV